MEEPLLRNPSSSTSTTTDHDMEETSSVASLSSTTAIVIRLSTIVAVAAVSLWANHEASKGFEISIVKATAGSHAGRRFNLMFVSNGRAARIVHQAGQLVERTLYPNDLYNYPRKPVDRVTLRMAGHNLTTTVSVASGVGPADFIISLSPSLMSMADANPGLASAVQRGMARVWLWDGGGTAPEPLLEAMVDYLAMIAGFASPAQVITSAVPQGTNGLTCWWSGEFLRHCEGRRRGFIARLNGAMRGRWSEVMVDEALGSPVRRMCAGYRSSAGQLGESSDATLESVELRQVM